jgi:[ribosomal protein S5]-alanine N-acetyltransferase
MEINIHLMSEDDMEDIFIFEKENRAYFEKSVPPRPADYYSYDTFKELMGPLLNEQENQISYFYIIRTAKRKMAGRINLTDIDPKAGTANIGYRIGENFAGRQIASSALSLLLKEAKEAIVTQEIKEIKAKTTWDNPASQRVLLRNGFNQTDNDSEFIYYSYRLTKTI